MACVATDGSLTAVAAQVLGALATAAAPGAEDVVAGAAGLPIYRVRATLRELEREHLVEDVGGVRVLTPAGRAKLDAAAPV